MAEQSKPNTFGGGMVTDLDPGYQPKDTYFSGLNIRVITNGNNSYSLENVKGPKESYQTNKYLFDVEATNPSLYLSGNDRCVIHGAVIVDDYIITIEATVASSNKTWKIRKYLISSIGDITNSEGFNTTEPKHLWSGTGLFSDNAGEIEMESAVETDTVHRVYCTDGITSLKSINVKENISSNDVNDFTAFKPDIAAQVVLNNYNDSGGQLKCGSYSYVYRLASANQSNYSDWSTISAPVNVIQGSLDTMDSLHLAGGTSSDLSSSSIDVSVTDIPTEYEIIQVAAIHYVTGITNTVSIIEEGDVSGTTYSFTHSGFETETSIDGGIASVLISNLTWDSCKSLAQKDNKLYAGNLTSALMDLDLNSYRVKSYKWQYANGAWNSSGHTDIHNPHRHYNGSGNNSSFSVSNNATDKNILKFINKNFNSDNTNQSSPKFVLGAETPGFSAGGDGYRITFTHKSYVIDDRWSMSPQGTHDTGITVNLDGSGSSIGVNHKARPYRVGDSYNSSSYGGGKKGPSNPVWDNQFRGFKRGECYRFGIVCYDLKGVPGFVHHIGDIKMPDAMDPNNLVLNSGGTDTELNFTEDTNVAYLMNNMNKGWQPVTSRGTDYNVTWGHALIPRIEVRFPDSIKNQISGYKIVKVEMSDNDKMIMTQGLLNHSVRYKNDSNTPNPMDDKIGIGYVPHGLTHSYTGGTNINAYAGAIAEHGYTLDTPDATIGGKSLSYGSGFDLKILYPVEMDMAQINYYQDNLNSSLSAQQQSGFGGRTDLWGSDEYTTSPSGNVNVARQLSSHLSYTGLSLDVGGTTNDPDFAGANILYYGAYHSYKYRPPKVQEDLEKHQSSDSECLFNSVKRSIKFAKKVVSGEEIGTSESGLDQTFINYAVHSQTASWGGNMVSNANYIPNSSGVDHQTQGHIMNGASTMFVSVEPANMPLPSAITVDNATDANIPTNHWFGHSHVGYTHGSRLWRWNTSKFMCEVIRDTSSGWEQFGGTSEGVIRNNRFNICI